MVTRREWYERVNSEWPENIPALTADEAIKAAKRLYRFVRGKSFPGEIKLTSGKRYTSMRRRYGVLTLFVNPTGHTGSGARHHGWQALVHDLSHHLLPVHHGGQHARLEARMVKEVVKRGWLNGALAAKPMAAAPEVDPKAVKRERILAGIKRWESKEKRAANALKKLRRRLRYCQ